MRVRPWLWISPSLAHRISPPLLHVLRWIPQAKNHSWRAFDWRGIHFSNPLGIAGGVDKDARNIKDWMHLGVGFVEVGTITPRPQPGNTPPNIARDLAHEALWNRLGFPSQGMERVKKRLMSAPRTVPIFANIGKNALTPLDQAPQDYLELLQSLHGLVDGFVINISSPNTKGLRELLQPERLRAFLTPIFAGRPQPAPPLLLKLSPDMTDDELKQALDISYELGIDGWILTNTSQSIRDQLPFPAEGGVSGRPLTARAREVLIKSLEILGPRRKGKLVVSVGGVMTPEDVFDRLQLGADLVQVYSALIFAGPQFFLEVAKCPQAKLNA